MKTLETLRWQLWRGEFAFSRETTERIRRMVHGEAQPVRAEILKVFAYAQ